MTYITASSKAGVKISCLARVCRCTLVEGRGRGRDGRGDNGSERGERDGDGREDHFGRDVGREEEGVGAGGE